MARYPACDKELLARRQVARAFALRRSVCPGPGREFVDEVVARGDELFGGYLSVLAEGRGVRDGGPFADFVEGAVEEIHRWRGCLWFCLLGLVTMASSCVSWRMTG